MKNLLRILIISGITLFCSEATAADCTYLATSVSVSNNTGCLSTTYTFTQTTCNHNDFKHTSGGGESCTITFPAGTDASTYTSITWDGTPVLTVTTTSATILTFIIPSAVGKNNSFDIIVNGVTNGASISSNCTVSADNNSGGTNSESAYNFSTSACLSSPGGIGVTNLNVWYKANIGTGAINTGDAISLWTDNSPAVAHATQATTSKQPTFVSANINYNPSLTFDGTDDYISHDLGANSYTSEFTMFTEVQLHSLSPEGAYFHNHWTTSFPWGDGDFTSFQLDTDGTSYRYRNNGTDILFGTFNLVPKLFTITNQNVGANTEVEIHELGLLSGTVSSGTNDRAQVFHHYELGTNRMRATYSNNSTAEIILYSSVLPLIDRVKVESYLAIKYGQTLDNSLAGNAGDYLSTTGNILWDASVNPSYHNNVIGIGREDAQALFQKQSHSLDDTSRIYKETLEVSNAANTAIIDDYSYILMGDNQDKMYATITSNAEVPGNCGLYSRLEREWKINRTSEATLFNVDLTLESFAVTGSVTPSDLRLLIDDDGDFSNGGTSCYSNADGTGIAISYAAPIITVSNISTTHIPDNSVRYFTIGSISIATPLPVELIDYTITCEAKPTLSWTTKSELNNNYFTVQRSHDGVNFETLSQISGAGNSTSTLEYKWTDQNPQFGTTYYRLSQTDFDGRISIFQTKIINCQQEENFYVYPTPFSELLTFHSKYEGLITIIDNSGKLVLEHSVYLGLNTIQTEHITAGSYILQFAIDNGPMKYQKLIKN